MLGVWTAVVLIIVVAVPKLFGDIASMAGLPPDKFGSMKPTMSDLRVCAGPKRANCSEMRMWHTGDYSNVTFNFTVKRSVQIQKIKIAIFASTSQTPDVLKWIDKPCENFFFGGFFRKFFNAAANCLVQKGKYIMNANITALFYEFMGRSFFYGTYRSHTLLLGKDCNFACTWTEFRIEKRKRD